MTFRRSFYISFAAHLVILGSAIAIAHYAEGTITSISHAIQVALVSSDPAPGPDTGVIRKPQSRPKQASSQSLETPVEHRDEVPEYKPADPGTSSLTSMEAQGTTEQGMDNDPGGGILTAKAGTGNGTDPGFGLIAPEQWSAIESAIERAKNYPRLARERGVEGVVRIRFRLNTEGFIEKIEVIESSGSEILDKASIQAVYRAAPMPVVSGWVEVPIKYVLK
jgi:protein TonB